MKHSRLLFGFFMVLGIVFLTLLLAGMYLNAIDAVSILASLFYSELVPWFALGGGIVFLTVGIVGIGRQHFKNHRNLFTALAVLLIPSLTFATMLFASVVVFVYAPMFPVRDEIIQVGLVNTNPLVLSLGVKAITSEGTRIDSVIILNSHGTMVAEYRIEDIVTVDEHGYPMTRSMPICTLSRGSSVTLTLRFNCTLPPGDYTVRLTSWHDNHGSAPFTIP